MSANIPAADGDLVPGTYLLSSQPVEMGLLKVQQGLFLFPEQDARMGRQHHR